MNESPDLVAALRAALDADGRSSTAIAQAAGVPLPSITQFRKGEKGLSLATAAKLARELGLVLQPWQ